MKRIIFYATALACMAVACNSVEDPTVPVQYGEISVSLGEPDLEVITKAALPDDTDNYTVRVFNSSDAQQGTDVLFKDFQPMKLPLGTYYVTAENCTEAEAEEGNGRMRLFGESSPVVLTETALSQSAEVLCTVANARVAVAYDAKVAGNFDNLTVTVKGKEGRQVTFPETEAGVETESWFNPQTISYTISGTFKQTGATVSASGEYTLAAKNNIKLFVQIKLDNGQVLAPVITINKEYDSSTDVPAVVNPYN